MTRWFVAAAFSLCLASQAAAWNALGHKIVAEIAWRQLPPQQRTQIADVLRRHPRFDVDFAGKMEDAVLKGDKELQDHWIFQHAATWPDIIRKNKEFDIPIWHYVDFPLFLEDSDRAAFANRLPVNISTEYPTRLPPTEYNVIQAIQHCRVTLRGKEGPSIKAVACCWLFHLVGDIHQPLHSTALFSASKFPKGDRGGNEILITKGKNLHAMWDILLGAQYYMRNVDKSVAELSDRQQFGDVWDSATKELDPRKWAEESHELCKSVVYSDEILQAVRDLPPGQKLAPIDLPESYRKAAGEIARKRVLAAGLRLGGILSETSHENRRRK
jgi:hypothetical protein